MEAGQGGRARLEGTKVSRGARSGVSIVCGVCALFAAYVRAKAHVYTPKHECASEWLGVHLCASGVGIGIKFGVGVHC